MDGRPCLRAKMTEAVPDYEHLRAKPFSFFSRISEHFSNDRDVSIFSIYRLRSLSCAQQFSTLCGDPSRRLNMPCPAYLRVQPFVACVQLCSIKHIQGTHALWELCEIDSACCDGSLWLLDIAVAKQS